MTQPFVDTPKVNILGIPFVKLPQKGVMDELIRCVNEGTFCHVVTANPEILMKAWDDPRFMEILLNADAVTADGVGILWAARRQGSPLPERVTGFDLMLELMEQARLRRWRVFLLGATEEVNALAAESIAKRFPGIHLVGRHHYFTPEEEQNILQEIERVKPHLLFVALGSPLQEYWIARHRPRLGVAVAMGVGGSLDVLAGKVKRASKRWQDLQLEWLYRLVQEPHRWRRTLTLRRFVWRVLRRKGTPPSRT